MLERPSNGRYRRLDDRAGRRCARAGRPSQPVKLIAPGRRTRWGRVVAEKMTPLLGQQVIVENKAGGNTIIRIDAVAKAARRWRPTSRSGSSSLSGRFACSSIGNQPHLWGEPFRTRNKLKMEAVG